MRRLVDDFVPDVTAVIVDVVVELEDATSQPVISRERLNLAANYLKEHCHFSSDFCADNSVPLS